MKNLLLYRWALFQILCFAGLAWAWERGFVKAALEADRSRISIAIVLLFGAAWVAVAREIMRATMRFNRLRIERAPRLMGDEHKERARRRWLHKASEWLVQLGLLGTVVGMVMAFGAVSQEQAASVEGVRRLVSQLMAGVGVALYTTMTGIIFGLWHEINIRMVETAHAVYWRSAMR